MGRIRALWELGVGVAGSGRLGISPWLCEAGARQDSMQHPCVHDLLAWQDMYGSEKLVCGRQSFIYYTGPYVFSAVRNSRMRCPHDIGRESWVWGEQGTLEMMSSPHEVGEEPLAEMIPWSGENGVALG